METVGGVPDRDDARRMMQWAAESERSTRNPPLPWAFFVLQATLLAAACWAQVLPRDIGRAATAVCLIGVVGVGIRWVYARSGYGFVRPDARQSGPYVLAMCVLAGTPAVLAVGLEQPWLWFVAGGLAALTTLDMGRRYRARFGHA
ncbi:hypothetical protein JVX90_08665 [Gordonia sp. PDNC005]|uniref:hypothetical protein n=1 Tax=unclassified Gordonia (in: high G+C Gram-positive bacteria) TaxID=2657482 RepID=UPI0019626544|nr:hypothetical protein [Gordonia sp. PDNC005]QRY64227.1 hypothetical protein JVX90_08665 [Gordonia sp. PDNC005]